MRERISLPE